jgi:hypothetical protein
MNRKPLRAGRHGSRPRGQGLVEFAMLVPVFLLLLLGMLEFGFAFTHDQTLAYATREGARTGAALGKGNTGYPCTTTNFDAPIIAAVERVLKSPGSPININAVPAPITTIRIYLAQSNGSETSGKVNVWSLALGGGPIVDGKALDFKETATGWSPCARLNGAGADALGVSLTYSYKFTTSFGGIVKLIGGSNWTSLQMSDKTVMNLNPTAQ